MKVSIQDAEGCAHSFDGAQITRAGDWIEVHALFKVHIQNDVRGRTEHYEKLKEQNPLGGETPIVDRLRRITLAAFYKPIFAIMEEPKP